MTRLETKDLGAPGTNPFTALVVTSAGRQAAAEKRYDQKRDAMWLAHAELSAVEREIRARTQDGRVVPAALQGRYDRAREAFESQKGLCEQASEVLRVANGQLQNAQKAAQVWSEREEHLARQAEADKSLTPRQRELRQLRDLQDRLGVS